MEWTLQKQNTRGVKEGWNQFKDGNWTQRVEIATEAAGIAAMLVEAGVRIKKCP